MAVLCWLGVVMSLLSVRNEPIAAIWSLPVIAANVDRRFPASRRSGAEIAARRVMETAAALVVAVAAIVIIGPRIGTPAQAQAAAKLPVMGVDRLLRNGGAERVFAEYGWGGYVISRLYDSGGRVFVDGRNDMYPQAILEDYSRIRSAQSGWEALLDRYGASAILLPPDAPLVSAAARSGWCEDLRDQREVLLLRCSPAQ